MPTILETDRLVLRTWDLADAGDVLCIYSDPEVTRFLKRKTQNLEEARDKLTRWIGHYCLYNFGLWAVVEKEHARVIGTTGLAFLEEGPDIEIGYHLARAFWGRGLATEGARACLQYAFDCLRLQRVVAVVDPANLASQRVCEKIGLGYERMGHYYGQELKVYALSRTVMVIPRVFKPLQGRTPTRS